MRVADVRLFWRRSVSSGIQKQVLRLTVDGVSDTGMELGPEVEEVMVTVSANSFGQFAVDTYDDEGKVAVSVTYDFRLGDLVDPLPATDLGHEIVQVRDDEPAPPV